MKNGNVCGNGNFTLTERSEQCRLADTVLTNQTIAATVRQSEVCVCSDTLAANGDVDVVDLDVFALALMDV